MIPKKIVKAVFERDGYQCSICDCEQPPEQHSLHCHHVKFKSQGGKDTPSNLITVCWQCHRKLHDGGNMKKVMPRGSYLTYEQEKQIIAETSKSHEEYERCIFELAKRLKI